LSIRNFIVREQWEFALSNGFGGEANGFSNIGGLKIGDALRISSGVMPSAAISTTVATGIEGSGYRARRPCGQDLP
jgi:hypothetical protein